MSDFAYLDRAAPAMPGHTCPEIDHAIRTLRDASKDADRASRHCEDDAATTALDDIGRAIDNIDLEPLREQNARLRECAEWWRALAETLCNEIDGLRGDLDIARGDRPAAPGGK